MQNLNKNSHFKTIFQMLNNIFHNLYIQIYSLPIYKFLQILFHLQKLLIIHNLKNIIFILQKFHYLLKLLSILIFMCLLLRFKNLLEMLILRVQRDQNKFILYFPFNLNFQNFYFLSLKSMIHKFFDIYLVIFRIKGIF